MQLLFCLAAASLRESVLEAFPQVVPFKAGGTYQLDDIFNIRAVRPRGFREREQAHGAPARPAIEQSWCIRSRQHLRQGVYGLIRNSLVGHRNKVECYAMGPGGFGNQCGRRLVGGLAVRADIHQGANALGT